MPFTARQYLGLPPGHGQLDRHGIENEMIEIWSVGRSCLSRPNAAASPDRFFAVHGPLEVDGEGDASVPTGDGGGDGVRSTATYHGRAQIRFRCGDCRDTIANGDRFVGRSGFQCCFIFHPREPGDGARLSYLLRPRSTMDFQVEGCSNLAEDLPIQWQNPSGQVL